MARIASMPEPNVDKEILGKANEPELTTEEMAMRTPMPKLKKHTKRLNKMTIKKSISKKKLVKKAA